MPLDDFAREVQEDLVGIQRIYGGQFRERKKKRISNVALIEEKWDKNRKGFSLTFSLSELVFTNTGLCKPT